jgi:hypothetical protein
LNCINQVNPHIPITGGEAIMHNFLGEDDQTMTHENEVQVEKK